MTDHQIEELQIVWEHINAALYDIAEGTPSDAIDALENCVNRLEPLLGETK